MDTGETAETRRAVVSEPGAVSPVWAVRALGVSKVYGSMGLAGKSVHEMLEYIGAPTN